MTLSLRAKMSWGPADGSPFVALRHFPLTVGELSLVGVWLSPKHWLTRPCTEAFRDGCDDCDGDFDGILFTVATVATVAPWLIPRHHGAGHPASYRSASPVCPHVLPCFHTLHGIHPAIFQTSHSNIC